MNIAWQSNGANNSLAMGIFASPPRFPVRFRDRDRNWNRNRNRNRDRIHLLLWIIDIHLPMMDTHGGYLNEFSRPWRMLNGDTSLPIHASCEETRSIRRFSEPGLLAFHSLLELIQARAFVHERQIWAADFFSYTHTRACLNLSSKVHYCRYQQSTARESENWGGFPIASRWTLHYGLGSENSIRRIKRSW